MARWLLCQLSGHQALGAPYNTASSMCARWTCPNTAHACCMPAAFSPTLLLATPAAPASAQVYAANRYSSSPKGRWLARGVDILLHQYPSLRVAFIDSFQGEQVCGGGAVAGAGWLGGEARAQAAPALPGTADCKQQGQARASPYSPALFGLATACQALHPTTHLDACAALSAPAAACPACRACSSTAC